MRAVVAAAILSTAISSPASVFAAGGSAAQNPYASLFTGQINEVPQQRPTPIPIVPFVLPPQMQSGPNPVIVCGMTVLQGDSKIDPAMPHRPPANAPKPSIRIMPAPMCRK